MVQTFFPELRPRLQVPAGAVPAAAPRGGCHQPGGGVPLPGQPRVSPQHGVQQGQWQLNTATFGVVVSTSGPYKNFIIDTLTLSNHRSLSCLVHFPITLPFLFPIFRCELKLKLLEYTSYCYVLFRM